MGLLIYSYATLPGLPHLHNCIGCHHNLNMMLLPKNKVNEWQNQARLNQRGCIYILFVSLFFLACPYCILQSQNVFDWTNMDSECLVLVLMIIDLLWSDNLVCLPMLVPWWFALKACYLDIPWLEPSSTFDWGHPPHSPQTSITHPYISLACLVISPQIFFTGFYSYPREPRAESHQCQSLAERLKDCFSDCNFWWTRITRFIRLFFISLQ